MNIIYCENFDHFIDIAVVLYTFSDDINSSEKLL